MKLDRLTRLSREAIAFYVTLFLTSYLLINAAPPLAFIFLGAAFILIGPFIVIERAAMPYAFLRDEVVSVTAGLLLVFIGGVCWFLATLF
jgi:hypothetical protein